MRNINIDYYAIDDLLSAEQKMVRQAVREFVQREIRPTIEEHAQGHTEIPGLMKKLGDIGALGVYIPATYGGAGLDQMSYGLIMQELEAGDSAVRSAASVQSSLVMFPIYTYGLEQQKQELLPALAKGDLIGAFGLTEPNHGSDPGQMETRLTKDGDGYRLNGAKMWITNAPICDVAVVWARDEAGKVRGVIVRREYAGFTRIETGNKWSLRASRTGELVFDNVYIRQTDILPDVASMKGPLSCLNSARYGISWGVIGAALDCYQTVVKYATEREQFGKPIAAFQLQQRKMAEMLTEITKAQLLSWRLGVLKKRRKSYAATDLHGETKQRRDGFESGARRASSAWCDGNCWGFSTDATYDESGVCNYV